MQVQQAETGTAFYKPNYDIASRCQIMGSPGWPSGSQDPVELISHLYGIHDLLVTKAETQEACSSRAPTSVQRDLFLSRHSFLNHGRWEHGGGSASSFSLGS